MASRCCWQSIIALSISAFSSTRSECASTGQATSIAFVDGEPVDHLLRRIGDRRELRGERDARGHLDLGGEQA